MSLLTCIVDRPAVKNVKRFLLYSNFEPYVSLRRLLSSPSPHFAPARAKEGKSSNRFPLITIGHGACRASCLSLRGRTRFNQGCCLYFYCYGSPTKCRVPEISATQWSAMKGFNLHVREAVRGGVRCQASRAIYSSAATQGYGLL